MNTESFQNISKKSLKQRQHCDSKLNPINAFFPFVASLKNDYRQFWHPSKKFRSGSKHLRKLNLSFSVPRSVHNCGQTHWKKIYELEKVRRIDEKLEIWKNELKNKCFFYVEKLLRKLLVGFFENQNMFQLSSSIRKSLQKTVRDNLSKECTVNFDDISSTLCHLPAEMRGLGVSSASLLALSAFSASAFVARDFLTTIFSETC